MWARWRPGNLARQFRHLAAFNQTLSTVAATEPAATASECDARKPLLEAEPALVRDYPASTAARRWPSR